MSSPTRRRLVLVALAGILAAMVAIDQFGGDAADPDSTGATLRDAYLSQAGLTEQQAKLARQSDEWQRLVDEARERWSSVRERMLDAPSADLASARLTQRVEQIMRDLDLSLTVSDALPVRRPLPDEPIHVVGLSFSFSALNPDVVARLVDRLENMPDVRTNVARLQINGPGRRMRTGLDVTIELEALAWISQGAAS